MTLFWPKSENFLQKQNTKQQKKQHKKEMLDKQIERQQQEIERLKTIIKYQDILGKFETTVRQDFSRGTNGAIVWLNQYLIDWYLNFMYLETNGRTDD